MVAMCNPKREASEEPKPVNTLILDFSFQNSKTKKFLLFKTLRLWYFVTAA